TFVAVAAATVTTTASPTSIVANGTSTSAISAAAKDAQGNPVPGVTVNWTTTAGTLDKTSSVTDANGVATVELTSPTTTGKATVEANSGGGHSSTEVTFVAGPAAGVTGMSTSLRSIAADGTSTSTISAVVMDTKGNPVPGATIDWTTTGGTLDKTSSVTDANGVASAVLTSSTTPGTATVTATSGTAHGSAVVTFVAVAAATVTTTASPTSIVANGTSTSAISAVAKDAQGNPVVGVTVNWTTTGGTLDKTSSVTDANGVATVELTSPTTTGKATVEANSGGGHSSTEVTFVAGPAAGVTGMSTSLRSIAADGTSTSTISAVVMDTKGNPVPGATVDWTTTGGTLDKTSSVTDANGVASAVLTSSTTPGTATVTATSGTAHGSTAVTFVAVAAATVTT
ncbi:protocatechuate 3,4-dioxygenase beta subunit, partial [Pseudomonas sp. TE3786]